MIDLFDFYPSHGISTREAYNKMRLYTELMRETGATQDEIDKGLVKWKRHLRDKIRKNKKEQEERKLVANWGETCVYLVRLGDFKNLGEADDYFMWNEYREYIPSAYDCTGQIFTDWYHLFKRHGVYYAYHSISIDV